MRRGIFGGVGLVILVVIAIAVYLSIFIISQTQQALVLRFGQVVREVKDPGLYYKLPLIDNVVYFDKRILDLDSAPLEIIASFRDVQAARADQERLQNEAHTYANRVIPEARGQASQITEAAIAYRDRITNEAQGQADRFSQVLESYLASPDVTRRRMYLETLQEVFSTTDKVIIDESAGGTGVVPYLPLDQLNRSRTTPPVGSGDVQ